MGKDRSVENVYNACSGEGSFLETEIDTDKIKIMLQIAEMDFISAESLEKTGAKELMHWNAIYKLYYDVLHTLVEAFILLDKIKVRTHECLFVYLCYKHSQLELDWNFFEKVRTKRNGSLYYGTVIKSTDWLDVKIQMKLYISSMKKAIKERLKE